MERNLTKYVTLEEASKGNYITAQMILGMAEKNLIPFFNDKGTIRVFPGDIAAAVKEIFGVREKKQKRLTSPIPEAPPETVSDNDSQPVS